MDSLWLHLDTVVLCIVFSCFMHVTLLLSYNLFLAYEDVAQKSSSGGVKV